MKPLSFGPLQVQIQSADTTCRDPLSLFFAFLWGLFPALELGGEHPDGAEFSCQERTLTGRALSLFCIHRSHRSPLLQVPVFLIVLQTPQCWPWSLLSLGLASFIQTTAPEWLSSFLFHGTLFKYLSHCALSTSRRRAGPVGTGLWQRGWVPIGRCYAGFFPQRNLNVSQGGACMFTRPGL